LLAADGARIIEPPAASERVVTLLLILGGDQAEPQ
jgi:hypothetical protein